MRGKGFARRLTWKKLKKQECGKPFPYSSADELQQVLADFNLAPHVSCVALGLDIWLRVFASGAPVYIPHSRRLSGQPATQLGSAHQ